jgi:starvation-inducible outer membrane lipoprotein
MKTAKRLQTGLLALGLMLCLTACTSPPKLVDPSTDTKDLKAGVSFTPTVDGCFVPAARMHQLLDLLSEKDVFGK